MPLEKERFTREHLTKDILCEELKRKYLRSAKKWLAFLACVVVVDAISLSACWPSTDLLWMPVLFLTAPTALALWWSISDIRMYCTCQERYTVVTDRLIRSGTTFMRIPRAYRREWFFTFTFAEHGIYVVDGYSPEYYTFSQKHHMFSDQLRKESHIDDEFYLLMIGEEIINVYNTKHFILDNK